MLRFASYNVHGCVGTDRRLDPARVAAVVREVQPDVLALQELEAGNRGAHAGRVLARAAGLPVIVHGPTLRRGRSHYGNALLLGTSPRRVRRCDLGMRGREPRGAVEAEVELRDGPWRIVVTHLGLRPRERRWQAARLLDWLEPERGPRLALLGDINEWMPSAALRLLNRELGPARSARTFPSGRPMLRLDRMWFRPAEAVRAVHAHRSPLARTASDHLPLCAWLAPASDGEPSRA